MKKLTIFFVVALMCSNAFTTSVKGAFDEVHNAVNNFKESIVKEQVDEAERYNKEKEWCRVETENARRILAQRQKDVDDIQEHIEFLENERQESIKDQQTREERIRHNTELLEKFKKERCDANLLFVKSLREHMEAIKVLQLLRSDIDAYFEAKSKESNAEINSSFIERFAEFSHLLDERRTLVFTQLQQNFEFLKHDDINRINTDNTANVNTATSATARTEQEIGVGHVDNDRAKLKKLDTPEWVSKEEYAKSLREKVLAMIDHLVEHLKESRKVLTKDEIQAAEDFAIFQTNINKENKHLEKTIEALKVKIQELNDQISHAEKQLQQREVLRDQAQNVLNNILQTCKEKEEYHEREVARMADELETVKEAIEIFDNLMENISARVRDRTNANIEERTYSPENANTSEVLNIKAETNAALSSRVGSRNEVVFPELSAFMI